MTSVRSLIQSFRFFREAYPQEASIAIEIEELFPQWFTASQQVRKDIDHQLKLKADKLSRNTLFVGILEQLKTLLSPEISKADLQNFLAEALFLSLLLKEKDLETLKQKTSLQRLLKLTTSIITQDLDPKISEKFVESSRELSDLLPSGLENIFWSAILSKPANSAPKMLAKKKINQLSYLLHYLLKRQLAISPEDANCRMLWLNTLESNWLDSFSKTVSLSEKQIQSERFRSICGSFSQAALHSLGDNSDPADPSWQDIMQEKKQGLQTSLFSSNSVTWEEKLLPDVPLTAVTLDLRADQASYPYQRKEIRRKEVQLREHFYGEDNHRGTPGYRELMLHRAEEMAADKSIIQLLTDRSFLYSDADSPLRAYLTHRYQQIFIMDFCRDNDPKKEGVCTLFLVSGKKQTSKGTARLMYASQPYQVTDYDPRYEFEDIGWGEVDPDKQSYWIKLGDSDFPNLIPAFGTKDAFFKITAHATQSLMPEWLTDDDPKLLQKKVKYLIREYQKSLAPKGKALNPEIQWPTAVKKMSEQGLPLEFDANLIRPIMLRTTIPSYLYAEEKLLKSSGVASPSIILQKGSAQAIASDHLCAEVFSGANIFPIYSDEQHKTLNISDKALARFRAYYQQKANSLDSNFIVFPPENITATLDRIASVSRDLPVLRKYPQQINQLLEDARNFTSDVELLSPPYEKIEEFRQKVLRLERDAIERKVIYQRVKTYIEELKDQLSQLTQDYDEAHKDLEAVNKENLFYYFYAVLQDPDYERLYADYLYWELARIPLYPHFRKWAGFGRELFVIHSSKDEVEEVHLSVQEEKLEESGSHKFTYQIHEDFSKIVLQERGKLVTISGVDSRYLAYRVDGLSLPEHLLTNWQNRQKKQRNLPEKFQQPILSNPSEVSRALSKVCGISQKTIQIREAIEHLVKR